MQPSLFEIEPEPPEGFRYQQDFLSPDEERELLGIFSGLPFRNFHYREYVGKRRTVIFGWSYSFDDGKISPATDMPDFLLPYRQRAADWAGLKSATLVQALVTEYQKGAAIGWHRDAPPFGIVLGISLASACRFRFRLDSDPDRPIREKVVLPRSIYALTGPARKQWQHGIPPATELRYSITFRTLRIERRTPVQ